MLAAEYCETLFFQLPQKTLGDINLRENSFDLCINEA